jgi:hypothetical protein
MTELQNLVRRKRKLLRPPRGLLAGLVVVLSGVLWQAPSAWAAGQGNAGLSKANRLVFMTDQLDDVQPPKRLRYRYKVSGSPDNFSDHIDLDIRRGNKQGKNVHVDFLSGKRHRYVPEISDTQNNPVTIIFLQHDVYMLSRRSGGNLHFFQGRIKQALQNNATIKKGTARYHGKPVDTTRISITPYARMTSHQSDMGKSLTERYIFTLSDDVPGRVLEIKSIIPGRDKAADQVHKLSLSSIKPLKPAKSKQSKPGEPRRGAPAS